MVYKNKHNIKNLGVYAQKRKQNDVDGTDTTVSDKENVSNDDA